MKPGRHNIVIQQGESFTRGFGVRVSGSLIDFTGGTAYVTIHRDSRRTSTLIGTFSTTVVTTRISFSMSSAETLALVPGEYYYDVLFVDSGGLSTYYVYGDCEVASRATGIV